MTDAPKKSATSPRAAHIKPKPGLLKRLLGLAPAEDDLVICIAPFLDAVGQDHGREVAEPLRGLDHIHLRFVKDAPVLTPEVKRTEALPNAAAQAMGWVGREDADLVIWGDIPPPGTTLFIHFAAPPPADADPAGTISPFQALNLPVGFAPESFGGLLCATALAAMNLTTDVKRQNRRKHIASALERAATEIENLPDDFTMREKASVFAAYANALATFAHLFPGTEAYSRAAQAYEQGLKGTMRPESPTNWAYLQRNLGTVLQALGERTDDPATLKRALEAYRAALEVFTLEATPFPWATTQNRVGEVLYRIDQKSGETAGLKEALNVYQNALKVLNRSSTPLLWAEVMNNFAQAAQVLGREINSTDAVERAVTAGRQALKVRTRDKHPTLWASTQNNVGSALFLLGRMTGDDAYIQQALEAFMGAREIYEALDLRRMVEITDKNIQHAQSRLPDGGVSQIGGEGAMWWLEGSEDDAPK